MNSLMNIRCGCYLTEIKIDAICLSSQNEITSQLFASSEILGIPVLIMESC